MTAVERWIPTKQRLPDYNVSVLVFIPEEDNHCTVGMWDVSKKWVLLDEYRVPRSEVTYWREMVDLPTDDSYTPSVHRPNEMDTITYQMRELNKRIFELEHADKEAYNRALDDANYSNDGINWINILISWMHRSASYKLSL